MYKLGHYNMHITVKTGSQQGLNKNIKSDDAANLTFDLKRCLYILLVKKAAMV